MKFSGWTAFVTICVLTAGCASSGDVEKARQESEQAKAKMRAELQQERQLAQSMEQKSEAQKAEAEKLAKAFGGTAQPKPQMKAPLRASGPMSLTTALLPATGCLSNIPAQGPNPAVQVLAIGGTILPGGGNSPCTSVTISTTDTTPFTATSPLIPVVVGSGGTLFIHDQPMTLYASSFLIRNGGTMQAGNPGAHVQSQITIVMAGNTSASLPPTTGDQNPNMRDITVMDGGTLALYGGKGLSGNPDNIDNNPSKSPAFINTLYGTKSWTYLAAPAGPAKYNDAENVSAPVPATNPATTLTLAATVDWKVNDWISVATTSFSSHQTEIVQICSVTTVPNPDPGYSPYPAISGVPQYTIPNIPTQVSQIALCPNTPLKHYHYGGLAPTPGFFPANTTRQVVSGGNAINVSYQARSFYDGSSRNYGIDERAEVALLSRNIKLTSVAGQSSDANHFIGGHLVAMVSSTNPTMPTVQLVGVEIEKFGQGLVGRYPVHLHKLPQTQITGAAPATDGNIAITTLPFPTNGAQAVISGVQGNTAANNTGSNPTWTVANANPAAGTFTLASTGNGNYTSGGTWTSLNTITNAANASPIVISSPTFPNKGDQVTISGVLGNTAANGTWQVASVNKTAGTFTLASIGNGPASQTGMWLHKGGQSGAFISQTSGQSTSPITITSPQSSPNPLQEGWTVVVSKIWAGNTAANGTWIAQNVQVNGGNVTFDLVPLGNGGYTGGGTWGSSSQTPVSISNATNASPIVVSSSTVPSNGTQVTIAGVQGNTAANGTWTVANANNPAGTFTLIPTSNGAYAGGGTLQIGSTAYPLLSATGTSPIVIYTAPFPANQEQVAISGVQGNTAANVRSGFVTNANPSAGTFELLGSTSNGTYTSGGIWTPATILIQDVSVHHSYNKCYVIHGTGNANFYNNVCVRTVGQGFYLEDGTNITGNQFMRNHIAGTMAALTTYSYPRQNKSQYWNGDNLQGYYYSTTGQPWYQINNWYNVNNVPDTSVSGLNKNPLDSTHPGGFWITNLGNTFVNNSVAGCQAKGRGYWLLSQAPTQHYGYPEFTGNRGHGCYNGIDNDDTTGNAATPSPMLSGNAQYAPALLLTDNTITRSRNKGVWLRNWYATLHNHRFATNLRGFSLLVGGGPEATYPGFWSLAYQNVIAGMTRNNVERYPGCPQGSNAWEQECTDVQLLGQGAAWGNYASPNTNIQGYSYYDGPARIEHNRFVNFRFDPTGIHPNDRAARLMTQTDIANIKNHGLKGQLEGRVTQAAANAAPSSNYQGYAGDVANGWQTSNAQTVPPTQYIRDSIWDNVDFKHQVYTEAVNMGPFNDGDKTTVIRDLDSHLSGLRVVDGSGNSHHDVVPMSLNSVDYFATEYTVDEPHSRGPNDFRATSLMSPHKYATLNIESVTNPPYGIAPGACGSPSLPNSPTCFRVEIKRDMPAYGDTVYPSLFLNGRGQLPIYEPFVMDRMGYTVYGVQGTEHALPYTPTTFQDRLLFSYTDPAVKKAGDFFVNRIAVYQPVTMPANIKVYRIRRQWAGQQYAHSSYPPDFNPPGAQGTSCDNVFNLNQPTATQKWQDCVNRASQAGGMTIPAASGATPADQWSNFEAPYKTLMGIKNPTSGDITNFINAQTYYYDTTNNLLYFYMIEEKPVQKQYSPYGTCHAAKYSDYVTQIQGIKSFSDPNSVQVALDASCLVSGGTPQKNDLFVCNENGCTAYLVDFSTAVVTTPSAQAPPQAITNVTYTGSNPIVITSSAPAPPTGTQVLIAGVQGITNANGQWTVTYTGPNTFSLNNSTGNGSYTTGSGTWTCVHCAPPHPISRTDYSNWNQYHLVYGTPTQEPNGVPVPATAPQDGTPLPGFMAPIDGTSPPTGNNITYDFLPLFGGPNNGKAFPVTENFRYHCVTNPPWSPVNARGAYPPTGGFTYPLAPTVCTNP